MHTTERKESEKAVGREVLTPLERIVSVVSSYTNWDSIVVQVFHIMETELGFENPHIKLLNFSKSLRPISEEREELERKIKNTYCVVELKSSGEEKLLISVPVRVEGRDIGTLSVLSDVADSTTISILSVIAELMGFCFFISGKEKIDVKVVGKLVFRSEKMKEVVELAIRVAKSDATVLIRGESGVGKELVVDLIHENSPRKDKPLVKINCAAIPSELLESELFGYRKGAFTGAVADKKGKFEEADGGTIFLDEIGDMPVQLQAKILRVLQSKEIEPLGGKPKKIDVRIIAATHRNLEELVKQGKFREDLYYRLNVVPITIPPLRERKEDIKPLVEHFLEKFNRKYGRNIAISKSAIDLLESYEWPGNVRELENLIERLVVVSSDLTITPDDIPSEIKKWSEMKKGRGEEVLEGLEEREDKKVEISEEKKEEGLVSAEPSSAAEEGEREGRRKVGRVEGKLPTLYDMEKELIVKALSETDFIIRRAAKILGITPRQLGYKIKKYGIKIPRRKQNI